MLRVMMTGARAVTDRAGVEFVFNEIAKRVPFTLVHGACPTGADKFAADWARSDRARSMGVTEEPHPANWNLHGKRAGLVRNQEMVDTKPDLVVAFPHTSAPSNGTRHTIDAAKRAGIPVYEYPLD